MKYLILSQNSLEYAKEISTELWNLRYPQSLRTGGETTSRYCGWVIKPDQSAIALAFPKDDDLHVHPEADMQPLIDLIKQGLPSNLAERVAIHLNNLDLIEGRKIEDLLPSLFADNLKEADEMADWFSVED
jgi:hypothetical protein